MYTDMLAESEKSDRDFAKVSRISCNDDILALYSIGSGEEDSKIKTGKLKDAVMDFSRSWFKAYDPTLDSMINHMILVERKDREHEYEGAEAEEKKASGSPAAAASASASRGSL